MLTRPSTHANRANCSHCIAMATQSTYAVEYYDFAMRSRRPCRSRRGRGARQRGWGLQHCAHCRSAHSARQRGWGLQHCAHCRCTRARQRGWGLQHCVYRRSAHAGRPSPDCALRSRAPSRSLCPSNAFRWGAAQPVETAAKPWRRARGHICPNWGIYALWACVRGGIPLLCAPDLYSNTTPARAMRSIARSPSALAVVCTPPSRGSESSASKRALSANIPPVAP